MLDIIKEKEKPVDKIELGIERESVEVLPRSNGIEEESKTIPKIIDDTKLQVPSSSLGVVDEELVIIESILSEDLSEIYESLSTAKQRAFKHRGEEVAIRVKNLMRGAKVRVGEIFELIKNWLKLLPKINIYFLEQEAKIKTDKILTMKREGQIIEK